MLICAQAAVAKLKAMTHMASVARLRPTGIRSIKTSVEARVIMLLENSKWYNRAIALPGTRGIIAYSAFVP
jgi:hypothetical protein